MKPDAYYGLKITAAEINYERLRLYLSGGKTIELGDDRQLCCEKRHMTTDDEVQSLVGHTLTRIEVKPGPNIITSEFGCHEQAFVEVGTDRSFITIVNHNEHNGYYGGFGLTITERNK